jgi:hypothetical protein
LSHLSFSPRAYSQEAKTIHLSRHLRVRLYMLSIEIKDLNQMSSQSCPRAPSKQGIYHQFIIFLQTKILEYNDTVKARIHISGSLILLLHVLWSAEMNESSSD